MQDKQAPRCATEAAAPTEHRQAKHSVELQQPDYEKAENSFTPVFTVNRAQHDQNSLRGWLELLCRHNNKRHGREVARSRVVSPQILSCNELSLRQYSFSALRCHSMPRAITGKASPNVGTTWKSNICLTVRVTDYARNFRKVFLVEQRDVASTSLAAGRWK
jgi:hypothetical protein